MPKGVGTGFIPARIRHFAKEAGKIWLQASSNPTREIFWGFLNKAQEIAANGQAPKQKHYKSR